MRELERVILLKNVDAKWMDHIDAMEDLKKGIYLRSYAQRDPVIEFRMESGEMFTEADIQNAAKVCIIGKTIVDNLFPNGQNPIGHIIRFNQVPLRVVGAVSYTHLDVYKRQVRNPHPA